MIVTESACLYYGNVDESVAEYNGGGGTGEDAHYGCKTTRKPGMSSLSLSPHSTVG